MTFHCRSCDGGVMIHRREHRYASGLVYCGWAFLGLGGVGAVMSFVELSAGSKHLSLLIVWAMVTVLAAVLGLILAHKRDVLRCEECGALRVMTPGVQMGRRPRGVTTHT